jgi:hypothetical protein
VDNKEAWLSVDPAHVNGPVGILQMRKHTVRPIEMNLHIFAWREDLYSFMDVNLGDLMCIGLVKQDSAVVAPGDKVFGHVVYVVFPAAVVLWGIQVDTEKDSHITIAFSG